MAQRLGNPEQGTFSLAWAGPGASPLDHFSRFVSERPLPGNLLHCAKEIAVPLSAKVLTGIDESQCIGNIAVRGRRPSQMRSIRSKRPWDLYFGAVLVLLRQDRPRIALRQEWNIHQVSRFSGTASMGVYALALGIAIYLPVYYWVNTRTFVPVDVPVSLAPGHLRTGDFKVNVEPISLSRLRSPTEPARNVTNMIHCELASSLLSVGNRSLHPTAATAASLSVLNPGRPANRHGPSVWHWPHWLASRCWLRW